MEETPEELAERELRKRKRLSDAASEALQKIAKERRHAQLTDLPEELFCRNVFQYLDDNVINDLVLDEWFFTTFNISDYWCIEHECFLMDT